MKNDGRSPVVDWLRLLVRNIQSERPDAQGVGAIGMCLTGGIVISLAMEPAVVAPVVSQPSIPLAKFGSGRAALGVPDEHVAFLSSRAEAGLELLGWRFTRDKLCPPERFERLRSVMKGKFIERAIVSGEGSDHGIREGAHSVLTYADMEVRPVRDAIAETIEFLLRVSSVFRLDARI